MTDELIVRITRGAVAAGATLAVGGSILTLTSGEFEFWWRSFSGLATLLVLCFGAFAWVLVPLQPRNAVVWTMATTSLFGLTVMGHALVPWLIDGDPNEVLDSSWVPADAPASVAGVLMVANPVATIALFAPLTLGLLLFPDGSLPTQRWRPVALLAVAGITATAGAEAVWYRPTNSSGADGPVLIAGLIAMLSASVLSLLALVLRFRSSRGPTRQQFKWVVFGAGVGVPAFAVPGLLPETVARENVIIVAVTLAVVVLASSYGIAVARYRLYDVEVVISRTLVFVGLVALIGIVYVMVVVGLGSAFGGSSLWLSVVATAVVAVVFEPARVALQRGANRLAYGRRATHFEVLAEVTDQLAKSEAPHRLLTRLADYLREGTGAQRAAVWRVDDGALQTVAVSPADGPIPEPTASARQLPGHSVEVEHESRVVGALTVEAGPGVPLTPSDRGLVEDLAGSAALVVRRVQLDEALAARASELEASRRRLLGAEDDERRRLERALRSGVEHGMIELQDRLAAARSTAESEGTDRTAALLDELIADSRDALDEIRSLARGIYPTLLGAGGLAAAVAELCERSPIGVQSIADVNHRHPRIHEEAVYFCVSEALTNAAKYAHGPLTVSIDDGSGELAFCVADAGPGFDPAARTPGAGLDNMADRLDALGGRLEITSTPGGPTVVRGGIEMSAAPVP